MRVNGSCRFAREQVIGLDRSGIRCYGGVRDHEACKSAGQSGQTVEISDNRAAGFLPKGTSFDQESWRPTSWASWWQRVCCTECKYLMIVARLALENFERAASL